MHGSIVIDTPVMGSVTTSSVCLKCPLNICDKDFEVDLVCLPLSQLDVILGRDWLRANHVYINCFAKAVLFLEPEKEGDLFLSTQQVNESVRDGAEVFMLVASLKISENGIMGEFPVVHDFPEVFPDEHVVQLDDVEVRDNLTVETIPMWIEDREVKQLYGKEIALVKVVWGGPAGGNVTWELESQMRDSYPELFT
ncbi:uncharacterized protein LOC127137691 [Lathyrus oleraceus]|uniref:uncharacterized protein LOC127137691 n=1 Tax=Pisum sativum TaxID=3888 RepID=UPI0021CE3E62|nr:uncharacterized protein LOC127137691 [Pisum sativum]